MQYKLEIMPYRGKYYWHLRGQIMCKTPKEAMKMANETAKELIRTGSIKLIQKGIEISEN